MINTKFEAYKIQREIKRSGEYYRFYRAKRNEFNEPDGEKEYVGSVNGLYHERNDYVRVSMSDTTQIRTKKIPMILCLFKKTNFLKKGDTITIGKRVLSVNAVTDIQEWGIVADISLEVLDDGL